MNGHPDNPGPDDIVARLARMIREITGVHDACTGDDLVAKGFSRADISRHGPHAVELATQETARAMTPARFARAARIVLQGLVLTLVFWVISVGIVWGGLMVMLDAPPPRLPPNL